MINLADAPAIGAPKGATFIRLEPEGVTWPDTGVNVQVMQPGSPAPTQVGQIEIASFFNEGGLEAIGDNLYMESGASGAATTGAPDINGMGKLLQGCTLPSSPAAVKPNEKGRSLRSGP